MAQELLATVLVNPALSADQSPHQDIYAVIDLGSNSFHMLMVKVVDVRPLPFLLSFIGAYMATHLAEAYCLRRLMAAG